MFPEARILEALLVHLQTLTGTPPVIWSNVQYPAQGQTKADQYIIVSFSPGTPTQEVIDSLDENKHVGILGLGLMSPLNGGELDSQELGGKVADHFHGRVLASGSTKVRITARPRVAGGYVDGDRWRTPVTVPFETVAV